MKWQWLELTPELRLSVIFKILLEKGHVGTAIFPSFQDSAVFLRLKEIKEGTEEPYMAVLLLTSVQNLTAT